MDCETGPALRLLWRLHFKLSLGFGLASNHVFLDGNKRIGALATQLLLKWNGYNLALRPGELSDMFISIADGSAGESYLLAWIQAHLK